MAKWENSFETYDLLGQPDVRVKDDFISPDPDRFGIYVKDPAANKLPTEVEQIQVSWFAPNGSGTKVLTLTESGPNTGEFNGPWLLLVSRDADLDTNLRDYTYKVALGDKLYASYFDGTKHHLAEAVVPVQKIVKVNVTILNGSGMTDAEAVADLKRAKDVYAQVGIKLVPSYQNKNPPPKVTLANGFDSFGIALPQIQMTQEERDLLGDATLRSKDGDAVELYYVDYFTDRRDRGESLIASLLPVADQKYADSSIISRRDRRPFTVAHEIGHVLLDWGDHTRGEFAKVNLMYAETSQTDSALATRRLTSAQQQDMHNKRPNLVKNP